MRDTTFARPDRFLQEVGRCFLFGRKSGVDAVDENVRVNQLRHAGRDHRVSSLAARVWLCDGNSYFVIAALFALCPAIAVSLPAEGCLGIDRQRSGYNRLRTQIESRYRAEYDENQRLLSGASPEVCSSPDSFPYFSKDYFLVKEPGFLPLQSYSAKMTIASAVGIFGLARNPTGQSDRHFRA